MKDMTKLVRQVADLRRLERRREPPPCGLRCPATTHAHAEAVKHRKCMRSAAGCPHALFR